MCQRSRVQSAVTGQERTVTAQKLTKNARRDALTPTERPHQWCDIKTGVSWTKRTGLSHGRRQRKLTQIIFVLLQSSLRERPRGDMRCMGYPQGSSVAAMATMHYSRLRMELGGSRKYTVYGKESSVRRGPERLSSQVLKNGA